MAWLIKDKRTPKGEAKKQTYYRIAWREEGKVGIQNKAIGFATASEAKQALKAFEARILLGLPPVPQPPTPTDDGCSDSPKKRRSWTLAEYLEERWYPAYCRNHSPKSNVCANTQVRVLTRIIGEVEIADVDFTVAEKLLSVRAAAGKSSRTRIIDLRALRQCLRHACDSGVIAEMPRLPTVRDTDRRRQRYLSAEESVLLLDALRPLDEQPYKVTRGRPPVNRDRLTYLVVLMALNTGMRKMEILTRKWSDVRWAQGSNGALFVGDQPDADFRVKTGRERTIPLAPQLKAELERAWAHPERSNSSWVFPAPHNPEIPRRDFIKALKRACRRAGIPEVGPHSLRHTWATRFAMQGCDRRTLMELGGWTASSRVLDEVYSHSSDAHKEEMIARLGIESSSGPTRARPSTVPSLRLVEDDSADSDRPPRPEQNPQRADVQNGE